MKICKDCEYYVPDRFFFGLFEGDYNECKRPGTINCVTGKPESFCDIERRYSNENECGPKAKHFKPKETK